jgi:ABC-type multidrug transport system permease subunit
LYFISGLQYDADRYFIFFGIFLLTNLLAISLCHIIGLLSPNVVIANSLSAILFTLFSLLAGFLITRDDIGGWWIWMHYIGTSLSTYIHIFHTYESLPCNQLILYMSTQ